MCCASFATDDQGQLYRWGMNQIEQTPKPIVDRFGDIINYTTEGYRFKCPNPFKIKYFICYLVINMYRVKLNKLRQEMTFTQ